MPDKDDIAKELEGLTKRQASIETNSHYTREAFDLAQEILDADCRRFLLLHSAEILAAGRMKVALEELVACKDLKDQLYTGDATVEMIYEYKRRKPLAWNGARAALAAATPGTHDAGKEAGGR